MSTRARSIGWSISPSMRGDLAEANCCSVIVLAVGLGAPSGPSFCASAGFIAIIVRIANAIRMKERLQKELSCSILPQFAGARSALEVPQTSTPSW